MISSVINAEPLRKKKRVDPQQEQNRIRRKAKRIEREIKRLARQGQKLKPVEEIEGDRQLYKEESSRRRPKVDISESEADYQAVLLKDWTRYQWSVLRQEQRNLKSAIAAQSRALRLLSESSPRLYLAAIQPCASLSAEIPAVHGVTLPIKLSGPLATPPLASDVYEAPDGEQVDTSASFNYDFQIDRKFLAEAKKAKFVMVQGNSSRNSNE